jgi:hypothetical protein
MLLHPLLKELLVCPQSRGELEERADGLFCAQSGLLYPIRDGIPVMLVEEATKVDDATLAQATSFAGDAA